MGRGRKFKTKTREETPPRTARQRAYARRRQSSSDDDDEDDQRVKMIDPGGLLIKSIWECFRCYDADKQKRTLNTSLAAYMSNRKAIPDLSKKIWSMTNVIVLGPLLFGTDPVDPFVASSLQSRGIIKKTERGCPNNLTRDVFALCRIVGIIVEKLETMIAEDGNVLQNIVEVLMERAFQDEPVQFGTIDFIDEINAFKDDNDEYDDDDGYGSKEPIKVDNRLKWIEKLAEVVFAHARLEPWYEKTDVISSSQMNALIFVVGKSYAFLVLLNVKWVNEADMDLFEVMLIRGVTHRQAVLYKERGNSYYEQCQTNPDVGTAFRKKMKWFIPITIYSMGVDAAPHAAVLFCNRAKCYLNQNLYEEALADSLRAVVLEPTWAKAYFRLGEALYQMGRFSDAVYLNNRARIWCQSDTKTNKEKDLDSLNDQSKTWTKKEDRVGASGGPNSWWDCSPKESAKNKHVKNIEFKLNYAVDTLTELLTNNQVLSLDAAQNMWQSSPTVHSRVKSTPLREPCSFAEAHEFVAMDAKCRIALFMTDKKEVYISMPDRMEEVRAKYGEVYWANKLSEKEMELSKAEMDQVDAKLAKNYRKDERFLLESYITDKNSRIFELSEQLKRCEIKRDVAQKQSTIVTSLLKAMEENLGTLPMPDLTCKQQLGDNLRSARRTAMGPLVEKLNEGYAELSEKQIMIEDLKKKLLKSEAKRFGFVEDDLDLSDRLRRKKCENCAKVEEENGKLKERERKVNFTLEILEEKSREAQKRTAKFDALDERIEDLTERSRDSREAVEQMKEELERYKKEAEESKLEARKKAEEAEMWKIEAEKREEEGEKGKAEAEKSEMEKKALEEVLKRKDDAIERCARENLLLRDKLENGGVTDEIVERDYEKKATAAEDGFKEEFTNLQSKYCQSLKQLEKFTRENFGLREENDKNREQRDKNMEMMEKFCVAFNRSTRKVLTAYEDDVFGYSSWVEEVAKNAVDLSPDTMKLFDSQKALGFRKIQFMQQIRMDNESSLSELKRDLREKKDVKVVLNESANPPVEKINFAGILNTMADCRNKEDAFESASLSRGGILTPRSSPPITNSVEPEQTRKIRKKFSDLMSELERTYPQIPSMVLSLVFRQYRQERGKLTGVSIPVIMNDLELRLDFLVQHLNQDDFKYIADGATANKRTNDECPICFYPMSAKDEYVCDRGHPFHRHCISSWCEKAGIQSCPTCRDTIILDHGITNTTPSLIQSF